MSAIWPGLFTIGIIIAISGGAKLPEEGQDWPDSVPIFLVGAALSVVGLVGWRRAAAQAASDPTGASGADPFVLLESVLAPARALLDDLEGLSHQQLCDRVDGLLQEYILPFAEVRQGVINRLGMKEGAEILVVIAYGERMLNRVWSAAADGHLPEATAVYPDALQAFEEAARLARAAREAV